MHAGLDPYALLLVNLEQVFAPVSSVGWTT